MLAIVLGATLIGYLVARLFLVTAQVHIDPTDLTTAAGLQRIAIPAIIMQAIIEIPLVVALLYAIPYVARLSLRDLGFVAPDLRTIAIALGAVVAAFIAGSVAGSLVEFFTHAKHPQETTEMFVGLHEPYKVVVFFVFATVFQPFVEELCFRVFLFNVGLRYSGFWIAAAVSSILFGLAHGDPANALPLAVVGMVFAGAYYLSRNAWTSVITHACFNLTTLIVLLAFPKFAGG